MIYVYSEPSLFGISQEDSRPCSCKEHKSTDLYSVNLVENQQKVTSGHSQIDSG